jgi:hypothetical protein
MSSKKSLFDISEETLELFVKYSLIKEIHGLFAKCFLTNGIRLSVSFIFIRVFLLNTPEEVFGLSVKYSLTSVINLIKPLISYCG